MFHVESAAFGQERSDGEKVEEEENRRVTEVGLTITWSRPHNAHATGRYTLRIVAWSTYSNVL